MLGEAVRSGSRPQGNISLTNSNRFEELVGDVRVQQDTVVEVPRSFYRNLQRFRPVLPGPGADDHISSFEFDFLQVCVGEKLGRSVVNKFLKVFQRYNIGDFPVDARSCLGSMRCVPVQVVEPGEYYHFGLSSSLNQVLKFVQIDTDEVQVQVNVDGLELSRSSTISFWPILCRALWKTFCSQVFVVGVYCGRSKPSSCSDFLRSVIDDLLDGVRNGVTVKGKMCKLKIHSILCDAPARQFVKCIRSHCSFFSCERCDIEGESVPKVGVRFHNRSNATVRSDVSFRAETQSEHHVLSKRSPFCDLPIDMVLDFPLDYMHLVLLGVVKRLLQLWHGIRFKRTCYSHMHRLKGAKKSILNNRARSLPRTVPVEFQRKPRPFTFLGMFKATEYRMFLCYTSPLLLHGLFECASVYGHFMLLVVGMRVLLTPSQPVGTVDFAGNCLRNFVDSFRGFYGRGQMVYNVHSVVHLVDDYRRFGNLDAVSCFPFESYMSKLKTHVKRPGKELAQVVKRLHESCNFALPPSKSENHAQLCKRHFNGPTGMYCDSSIKQYGEVIFSGRTLKIKSCNDVIFCSLGFCKVVNILSEGDHVVLLCRKFLVAEDVFDYPCPSRDVGIAFVSNLSLAFVNVHVREAVKCWCMDCPWDRTKWYVVKLLHHSC